MTKKNKFFKAFDQLLNFKDKSLNIKASQFDSKYSSRYKQLYKSQNFTEKNKNIGFLKIYAGLISFFAIFISVIQFNTVIVRSVDKDNNEQAITSEKTIATENPYTFTIFLIENSLEADVQIKNLRKTDNGYEFILSGLKSNSEMQIYLKSLVELDNGDQGSVKILISSDED